MRIGWMVALLLIVCACGSKKTKNSRATVADKIEYAQHFKILEREGYTELQLLDPETGDLELAYALVKEDSKAWIPGELVKVQVPVKNMAVLSTTHIGMLSALNATSCIGGTTGEAYIYNPAIKKGIASGKVKCFSDEASMSPENLLARDLKLVMYSGFGKDFPHADKLLKLGIVTMPNYDWREEHPLGKAEWIKVFGYLIDQPEEAITYFEQVEKTYNEAKEQIAKAGNHPKVLVGSVIGDTWIAPGGKSYVATILEDAGCDYVYKNDSETGSCKKTLEQVYKDQTDVQFWINPGAVSLADLSSQQPKYALFSAYQKGKVYCYTWNSNYFWEMGTVNPHWLLQDFATIIGTEKKSKLHFYRQLK